MTDVDAVAMECAETLERKWRNITMEGWDSDEAAPIIATALRSRDAEWQGKLEAIEVELKAARLYRMFNDGTLRNCLSQHDQPADVQNPVLSVVMFANTKAKECRALLAEVERLRGEVRDSRKLVWHLIEAAGGRVQISDLQLASVGPHDDCRVEAFVDARNRCTELRSVPNYSATTT